MAGVLTVVLAAVLAITYLTLARAAVSVAEERLRRAVHQLATVAGDGVRQGAPRYLAVTRDGALRRALAPETAPPVADSLGRSALARLTAPTDSGLPIELWTADGRRVAFVGRDLPPDVPIVAPERRPAAAAAAPVPRERVPAVTGADSLALGTLFVRNGRAHFWLVVPVRERGATLGYIAQLRRVGGGAQTERTIRELSGDSVGAYYRNADGSLWATLGGMPARPPVHDSTAAGVVRTRPGAGRIFWAEQPVKGTPLFMVFERSRRRVLAAPQRVVATLAGISLLLLAVGTAIAWALSRRITRPIVSLTTAAEALAHGDYTARASVAGIDEVARLGTSFNRMAAEVASARDALERRSDEARAAASELAVAHERLEERRDAAEAAAARTAQLQSVTAALSATLTPDAVARVVLQHAVTAMGARAGSVAVLDPAGRSLVLLHAIGYPAETVARFARVPVDDGFPLAIAVRTGEPLFLATRAERTERFPQLEGLARSNGAGAMAVVPLTVGGRRVGALGLNFREDAALAPDDRGLLLALADQCAQAIERARLYAAEGAARRNAERLHSLAAALSDAVTPRDVAATLLAHARDALDADAGAVAFRTHADGAGGAAPRDDGSPSLATPDGDALAVVATSGLPDEWGRAGRPMPLATASPLAEAVRARSAILVEDAHDGRARYPESAGDLAAFPAWVVVPLLVEGRAVGALGLGFGADRCGADERTDLVESLARLGAQAVRRATLYATEAAARRSAEAAERRFGFLAEVGATLAETALDYEATLARAVRLAVPAVADYCIIDLADANGRLRRLAEAHVDPAKEAILRGTHRFYPTGAGVAHPLQAALEANEPRVVSDVSDEWLQAATRGPEHLADVRKLAPRSIMIVPLHARRPDTVGGETRPYGLVTLVATPDSGRRYGPADLALAEEFARRAATAVENSRLFRDAEAARAAAEAASAAKSAFVATMSHELRTPINAILGYAELLELGLFGPLSDEQRAQLARIGTSTHHLLGLVNDVLDLAKVESGTVQLERARAVAGDAVDAALTLVRPQATAKGVDLVEHCGGTRTAPYLGDEHRVRQVVTNLLSNAVKFTPPGGRVDVACAQAADPPPDSGLGTNRDWVAIRVRDTGVGIAAEQLARIFEPFTQAETGYTRAAGGAGLGLTISRELAQLMGGEITVESAPGAGSRFTLWLPGDASRAGGDADADARATDPPARDARDTTDADEARGRALERMGHRFVERVHDVVESWIGRIRAEPAFRDLDRLTDAQVANHTSTYLTDIGVQLVALGAARRDPPELLRDGTAIATTIAERHARQRHRLGWTESDLRCEWALLVEVVREAVSRAGEGDAPAVVAEAQRVVRELLGHAERVGVGAFRLAADDGRR